MDFDVLVAGPVDFDERRAGLADFDVVLVRLLANPRSILCSDDDADRTAGRCRVDIELQ
jgi:hypothetical protein